MRSALRGHLVLFALTMALALFDPGCSPMADENPTGGAPFIGPSFQKVPRATPPLPQAPPFVPPAVTSPPPTPSVPALGSLLDDAAVRRREAWLTQPFKCKAISTTKLRRCKFEAHDGGHRIKFQVSDVVCDDVEFDASGNPSRLVGCVGAWLRVPRGNKLKKAGGQDIWSGSHRGWKWKDGSKYCCPGLWLEPPNSIAR